MNRFRLLASAFVAALCLTLVSCIDGREEIWLNPDGSGRADLSYDIPAAAARFQGGEQGVRDLIESLLKDLPSHRQEITTEGSRLKAHVTLDFKSADELASFTTSASQKKMPSSMEHLAGIFAFNRSWRSIDITRTISPGKALPTAFIPQSEFKNRKLTYILHLPVVPTESNATRLSDGGKTLIWEQTLPAAIRQPIVIHFKGKIPIPGWMIATAAAVIILILLGAHSIIRVRRRRHLAGTSLR